MELAQNFLMVKHRQAHLHVMIAQLAVVYASLIHYYKLIFANPVFLNMDSLTLAVLIVKSASLTALIAPIITPALTALLVSVLREMITVGHVTFLIASYVNLQISV